MGSIFVRGDVESALKEFRAIKKILAGSNFHRRIFRLEILQIHFRLRPAFANINQQPAVIFGESDVRNVLRIAAFAEDERVLRGIATDLVVENLDVVDLFALRDLAFLGMAGVVEAGTVLHPGHAGEAGTVDRIRQYLAGRAFDDMECALLRSAGRRSIGHVFAVFGREPPVQCNRTVGGHFIHVDQYAIVAV